MTFNRCRGSSPMFHWKFSVPDYLTDLQYIYIYIYCMIFLCGCTMKYCALSKILIILKFDTVIIQHTETGQYSWKVQTHCMKEGNCQISNKSRNSLINL